MMLRITYFVHGTTTDNENSIATDSAKLTFGNNTPIIRDSRLRECNYGDLNGADARRVESITEACIDNPFPNGESCKDVEKRVRSFLKDLKNNYAGKQVDIISHRGPQLALDVIVKKKTWKQAIKEDWRKTEKWKPGWSYKI